MVRNIMLFIIVFLSLTGCNSGIKKITINPADLQGKGILVANITSNNYLPPNSNVYISGDEFKDSFYKNHIVIPMLPGKYNLDKIGSKYQENTFRRDFTIHEGKITNLGHFFAYFDTLQDKYYKVYLINNSKQIAKFLKTEHPAVYPLIKDKKIRLEDGNYLSSSKLNDLKKLIALNLSKVKEYKDGNLIPAALGTVAWVDRNKKNKVTNIRIYKTNTLDSISRCSQSGGNFACIVNDKILIGNKSGKTNFRELPKGINNAKIHIVGKNNILLVDDSVNLYESNNGGKTFIINKKYAVPEPLEYMSWIDFYDGQKGFYLTIFSHTESEGRLLYKPYKGNSPLKSIHLPEGVKVSDLNETKENLILGGYPGLYTSSDVYYKKHGSISWNKVIIPTTSCRKIEVLNYITGKLKIDCSYMNLTRHFISKDAGKSWKAL